LITTIPSPGTFTSIFVRQAEFVVAADNHLCTQFTKILVKVPGEGIVVINTWNLYQYFCELGAEVVVRRNDELSLSDIETLAPHAWAIA
jgi:hypothetical protein